MKYLWAAVVFAIGEVLSVFIFAIIRKVIGPPQSSSSLTTALKGMLERLVLLTGLLHGFPHILIAFGALKIGTRLHEEKETTISNTYFLVGNLLSLFIAMAYAIVTGLFWNT
jgi:hypothetical protein